MAQTSAGAMKMLAAKAGVTLEQLAAKHAAGEKWCWACTSWKSRSSFNVDRSRYDGCCARCQDCTRVKVRKVRTGPSPMKGRAFSAEARARMGRRGGFVSEKRGRPRTLAERAAISAGVRPVARRGAACHTFIDGKGAERHSERITAAAKQWAYDVKLRDGFTCQHCRDDRGGNLHAHHKKPWAKHPELRFDLANGITLCDPCHRAEHKRMRLAA